MYRYDRNDYDCEVFRFARLRARNLYRFFKTMYCGDVEDLEQAAMIAAVQIGDAAADPLRVPFEPLKRAVDRAIRTEAGAFARQDACDDAAEEKLRPNGKRSLEARKTTETGVDKAEAATKFRNAIICAVGAERYHRLVEYYVDYGPGREAAEKIAARINGKKPKRYHVSAEKIRKQIEDDARLLSSTIREPVLNSLLETRDLHP